MTAAHPRASLLALAALVAGALAMGISPVFVRLAEVGPYTSAFYRVFLALPLLWAWARQEARSRPDQPEPGWSRAELLAGIFFSADLFFWHLAIFNTTIANATFLATLAPVWVALFSGLFIGEPVTRRVLGGLAICILGGSFLIGSSYSLAPERLVGDFYGVMTSVFFGLYFLAVRVARRDGRPGLIVFRSTLMTSAVLFVVALAMENAWLPMTFAGVAALVAMAAISHVGGQGLLAYALGHLSAAFSALVIFLEALFAAGLGLVVFGEAITPLQLLGGAAILAGIWIARPREG